MADLNRSRIKDLLANTVGPAPWYWKTFLQISAPNAPPLAWTHHGDQGAIAHLVTLGEDQPDQASLALNTYCRPFPVPPSLLGIWCPEGRNLRVTCFDPAHMQSFALAEVAGWFKRSAERIYSATPPVADFEIQLSLAPGTHKIDVPPPLRSVDELIVPTSYKALSPDDPAFAIFIFYLQAGLVDVLPQKWFTAAQYEVGKQWITRVARDPDSNRLVGECFGEGIFVLEEDGCRLAEWIERNP